MPQWTKEQQTAIEARSGALVLSAAAGSGKTAVLTERAVRLMLDGKNPVDADRLLIVTFTKAAATEMRSRIAARLSEVVENEPNNLLARRQQLLLPRATIATIHSFCLSLIQAQYGQTGLSPDFVIADTPQLDNLRERAAAEVIEEAYATGGEAFKGLVELLSAPRDDRNLVRTLFTMYDFVRSHPSPERWMRERLAMYDSDTSVGDSVWGRVLCDYVGGALDYVTRLSDMAIDEAKLDDKVEQAYGIALGEDRTTIDYLKRLLEANDWDRLYETARSVSFGTLKAVRGVNPVKESVKRLRDAYKSVLGSGGLCEKVFVSDSAGYREDVERLRPLMSALTSLCVAYGERYAALKEERSWLDYSDLEHKALALLQVDLDGRSLPTQLAQTMSEHYAEVMIDEYQDCNEAQDRLFRLVSDDGKRLFVVGDVKQSIYGFRQAMPDIFLKRVADARDYDGAASPARVFLAHNFRSAPGVLSAVNFLFGQLMSRGFGGLEYDGTQRLRPGTMRPADSPAAELRLLDTSEADGSAFDAEVGYLVDLVGELCGGTRRVWEHGEPRPIRPGDIAILMRAPGDRALTLAKALEDAGYESWYETDGGYFDAREVQTMLALLRVVDNPAQDVPLLGLMLSPLFGFTADDVARVRAAAPKEPLYKAVLAASRAGDRGCADMLRTLRHYRALAATRSAPELLRALYAETEYLLMVQAGEQGERRAANLQQLLEYAARYDDSGGSTLSGFLRFIDRVLARGGDLGGAKRQAAPDSAVRIMTIHHSKGLQFPVVIVADTAHRFNRESVNGRTQLHAALGFSAVRVGGGAANGILTVPHAALKKAIWSDMMAEELRMLYVAATRAESLLVYTCAAKDPAKRIDALATRLYGMGDGAIDPYILQDCQNMFDWLLLAYLRHPDAETLRALTQIELWPLTLPSGEPMGFRLVKLTGGGIAPAEKTSRSMPAPDPALTERLRERLAFRYPYEALLSLPAKLTVTQIAKGTTAPVGGLRRPRLAQSRGLTPAERGTVLHRYMQFADFEAASGDPAAELARLCGMGFFTDEEAAAIDLTRVARFMRHPLMQRMRAAPFLKREFSYIRMRSVQEVGAFDERFANERITVQGMVDCVYGDSRGLVCVDYKTDHITSVEAFLDRYRPQLELYRTAVAEAFDLPVLACVLYSFERDEEFTVIGESAALGAGS